MHESNQYFSKASVANSRRGKHRKCQTLSGISCSISCEGISRTDLYSTIGIVDGHELGYDSSKGTRAPCSSFPDTQIIPFIDGLKSVKKISVLADVDFTLTKRCMEHLR